MTRPAYDPFGERISKPFRKSVGVLGCQFAIESSDERLMTLALDAFDNLPKQKLSHAPSRFKVTMILNHHKRTWPRKTEPPRPVLNSGNGLLCATMDTGNFAIVNVPQSQALVCVSAPMLGHPYHVRYELIEFAFLTLASRAQSLISLHAGCVGSNGLGLLLMGASGTGKSTLGLHALVAGMEMISEDSSFVTLPDMSLMGVPNYLYVRRETLGLLKSGPLHDQIIRSPKIRRRSGVQKYEVDLRQLPGRSTRKPLKLAATIMLTRRSAGRQSALRPLSRKNFLSALRREQPYALGMPNWNEFQRSIANLPTYELRRKEHPEDSVRALQTLLD